MAAISSQKPLKTVAMRVLFRVFEILWRFIVRYGFCLLTVILGAALHARFGDAIKAIEFGYTLVWAALGMYATIYLYEFFDVGLDDEEEDDEAEAV